MNKVRLATCAAQDELLYKSPAWNFLVEQSQTFSPDILLLNDLPFGPWIAADDSINEDLRVELARTHEEAVAALGEFGAKCVLGTMPRKCDDTWIIEAFVWHNGTLLPSPHSQQLLPDENDNHKSRWFSPGRHSNQVLRVEGLTIGFLIGVEAWCVERARIYGALGADLIVVPRCSYAQEVHRWEVALAAAAATSGCYIATADRIGPLNYNKRFSGKAFIAYPNGVVGHPTGGGHPLVCCEIDPQLISSVRTEIEFLFDTDNLLAKENLHHAA